MESSMTDDESSVKVDENFNECSPACRFRFIRSSGALFTLFLIEPRKPIVEEMLWLFRKDLPRFVFSYGTPRSLVGYKMMMPSDRSPIKIESHEGARALSLNEIFGDVIMCIRADARDHYETVDMEISNTNIWI
jgi:hypothetical protein